MYHRHNRRRAVIASAVIVVLLLGGYVFARKPYSVYATNDDAACAAGKPLVVSLSGSDAALQPGESRDVKVKASQSALQFAHLKVGFRLFATQEGALPIEMGMALSDEFTFRPGASVEKVVRLAAPSYLPAASYGLQPVAFDGNVQLNLADSSFALGGYVPASSGGGAVLAGKGIKQAAVATGKVPDADTITQQFLQYDMTSPADTTASVRWRVFESSGGERALVDDVTYSQAAKAGDSLTRLYFLDPTKFASGDVQTDVTSGGVTSTAHMFFTGAKHGLSLGEITQQHQGGLLLNRYATSFCLVGNAGGATTLKLTVAEGSNEIWSQTVPVTEGGGYGLKLTSVAPRRGLSVTASLMVDGSEIARRTNDYL